MTKRLAVFDLDGTLVDSGKVVASILNQIRREIGKDDKRIDFFIPWLSLGGEELVANGLEINIGEAHPFLEEFRRRYAVIPTPTDTVYEGVTDLLIHLKERDVQMCICTNKPRNLAEKVLIDTELASYFEFMCAGGDLNTKKPNPQNLDVCIKYFGESYKNTILIGDSTIDQKISESLEVDFAFFTRGYDDGVDDRTAYLIFENHLELKSLFIFS